MTLPDLVDFHVHLGDVCSHCHHHPPSTSPPASPSPNLLDIADYHPILQQIIRAPFFPMSIVTSSAARAGAAATAPHLLNEMRTASVRTSVVLPIEPMVRTQWVMEQCRANGDALIPFLSVDFQDPRMTISDQVTRGRRELGLRGIKFHPNLQGVDVDAAAAHTLYRAADREGLLVLLHGGETILASAPNRRRAGWERLLPVLRLYPSLKFVVAHAGGGQFERSDHFLRSITGLSNVFIDTSGIRTATIREALAQIGPDRILFGSDWPYGGQRRAWERVERAVGSWATSRQTHEDAIWDISARNARRLLR